MTPAVSVIVPTWGRRESVLRAVRSVLRQTFEDFELIVVDDGSTDGTGEALAGLDPRLRYVWQENRGVAAARNAGLRLATGGIVAFLDSDNRWRRDHLSVVTGVLRLHPEAVLVTTCPQARLAGDAPPESAELLDLLPRLIMAGPIGYTSCVAVRRESVLAVGGFDEGLAVLEDVDLWLRLSMLGPVCMLPHRTIEHTVSASGLKERGIESGAYLEAFARSAATAAEALERLERPDASELRARARAKVSLVEAVRAIHARELEEGRAALEAANRLMPSVSDDPNRVVTILVHTTRDPAAFVETLMATARLWPNRRCDTARYLWAYAFVRALRAGRAREAVTCLRALSRPPTPSFLVRQRELIAAETRLWLHHRGRGGRGLAPNEP